MSIFKHIAALGRVLARLRGLAPMTDEAARPLHDHTIPCRYPGGASVCKCAERMGNDFYFLPADRCLWDGK